MNPSASESFFNRLSDWFSGWRFPVLFISIIVFFTIFLFSLLLIPESNDALGQFARDFRTWCFGVDPYTGKVRYIYGIMLVLDPIFIIAIVYFLWRKPLIDIFKERPATLYRSILYGIIPTIMAAVAFVFLSGIDGEVVAMGKTFDADRLRTSIKAPAVRLTDQNGASVDLNDYKGKVVLVTAFYATCGHTCPRIMQQVRGVVDTIPEDLQNDLIIMPITMDPKTDTPPKLKIFAKMQKMSSPNYHFLSGDAEPVNAVLDSFSIARKVNSETGDIDHANLIYLIDRKGLIAYRFGLGALQEEWLAEAMLHLIRE